MIFAKLILVATLTSACPDPSKLKGAELVMGNIKLVSVWQCHEISTECIGFISSPNQKIVVKQNEERMQLILVFSDGEFGIVDSSFDYLETLGKQYHTTVQSPLVNMQRLSDPYRGTAFTELCQEVTPKLDRIVGAASKLRDCAGINAEFRGNFRVLENGKTQINISQ